jgi:peroxiredoxin
MRATTENLVLFAVVALASVGLGVGVLRLAGDASSWFRALLRVVARVLVVAGLLATGILVWNHVSGQLGPQQAWHRAPSFYIGAAVLCAVAFFWFRQPRGPSRASIAKRFGYPVLLIACVGGWQSLVNFMQENARQSLHSGLDSTRGQVAPEMEFLEMTGDVRRLSSLRGKLVLLNFWTTTCAPCLQEMPTLSDLQRKFQERGFVLAYLSPEDAAVQSKFFGEHELEGIKGRLVAERPVPAFYQYGNAWPLSVLINRDGVVEDAWVGVPPQEWIESKIENAL